MWSLWWGLSFSDFFFQSNVLAFVRKHLDTEFAALKSKSIEELGLGFKEVISVSSTDKVWRSFILMDSKVGSSLL